MVLHLVPHRMPLTLVMVTKARQTVCIYFFQENKNFKQCTISNIRIFLLGGAVICAGVTCRAQEKCQFDRNTKREKCVRG